MWSGPSCAKWRLIYSGFVMLSLFIAAFSPARPGGVFSLWVAGRVAGPIVASPISSDRGGPPVLEANGGERECTAAPVSLLPPRLPRSPARRRHGSPASRACRCWASPASGQPGAAPKANPLEGEHHLSGFLTTDANVIVAPIHPKVMRVILRTRRGMRNDSLTVTKLR
jgi:hypothetical protein